MSISDQLKADETESQEERKKRIFLQEIWEVCMKYRGGDIDFPEEKIRINTK